MERTLEDSVGPASFGASAPSPSVEKSQWNWSWLSSWCCSCSAVVDIGAAVVVIGEGSKFPLLAVECGAASHWRPLSFVRKKRGNEVPRFFDRGGL